MNSKPVLNQSILFPTILSLVGLLLLLTGIMTLKTFSIPAGKGNRLVGISSALKLTDWVPDSQNEGKLVELSGTPDQLKTLTDPEFGISINRALKLSRYVEMYQWTESKEAMGENPETNRILYKHAWSSNRIPSEKFLSRNHSNPELPWKPRILVADSAMIGDFVLPENLVSQLGGNIRYKLEPSMVDRFPLYRNQKPIIQNDILYYGNPRSPETGDLKITFTYSGPVPVTVLAKQTGNSFSPYELEGGETIYFLQNGEIDAKTMLNQREDFYTVHSFEGKLAGFLILFMGFFLLFTGLLTGKRIQGHKTRGLLALILATTTFFFLLSIV